MQFNVDFTLNTCIAENKTTERIAETTQEFVAPRAGREDNPLIEIRAKHFIKNVNISYPFFTQALYISD